MMLYLTQQRTNSTETISLIVNLNKVTTIEAKRGGSILVMDSEVIHVTEDIVDIWNEIERLQRPKGICQMMLPQEEGL